MIRITSTALTFTLYGYVNAADCGPAFERHDYFVGDKVSALSPSSGELHNYESTGSTWGPCMSNTSPWLFVNYLANGGSLPSIPINSSTSITTYSESWSDLGACTVSFPLCPCLV